MLINTQGLDLRSIYIAQTVRIPIEIDTINELRGEMRQANPAQAY